MNRYLDQLKSAKAHGRNPTEPTQAPSGGFGGSLGSAFSKIEEALIDGPFTPWHPPVSPNEIDRLHALIHAFSAQYRLSEEATQRIIDIAKRQPAATVPNDIRAFERAINAGLESNRQRGGRKA